MLQAGNRIRVTVQLVVNCTVREYLAELERENPVEPPVPQQEKVSTTDSDPTYGKPDCDF